MAKKKVARKKVVKKPAAKATKKAASSEADEKKKVAKRKSSKAAIRISWGMDIRDVHDDDTLFLMPIACPRPSDMSQTLIEELRVLFGESMAGGVGTVSMIMKAHEQGRVLWGWSPWRAKANALTWAQWDAFCQKWLELCPELLSRPSTNYGEDKSASVEALAQEVNALVNRKKLKLISNYPFGYKAKKPE